jgi:hypothetical protein
LLSSRSKFNDWKRSRATRRPEDRAEKAAIRKEERTALATSAAALNLAILAPTQINDLRVLLKDEAWRGRIAIL